MCFILILSILSFLNTPPQYMAAQNTFDWQGHRGARGLMPENTIPAFLKALDLGVTTLELDLAVSADNQLIISHEPWLNHEICSKADGTEVKKEEAESLAIHQMTAEELKKCDCGSRGNPRFPEQQKLFAHKPTLSEMVAAVKQYCTEKGRPLPYFNMEIKSQPAWDGKYTPSVSDFAKLVLTEINRLGIKEKTCVQSFDPRALEAIKQLDKSVTIAFLIENINSLKVNLKLLSFKPSIYSPYFKLISKKTVKKCHALGIKIIPWTVNELIDIQKIKSMGVDGIITDYPNRIFKK
jgi:glycerophosphoryl diester phosphodiesterase